MARGILKEGHLREENDLSLGSTELKSSHPASRREMREVRVRHTDAGFEE